MTSSSFVFLLLAALNTASGLHPYEAVEPHMGTLVRIKLYTADEQKAQRAFHAAFARIAELDRTLSDYKPESELSRLPELAFHHPVHVSDDLYRVLDASQTLAVQTDGEFDITIGALTHLWREARRQGHLPDSAAIAQAKSKCGYHHLHLDKAQHSVEIDQAGLLLDVGAIAKGYAADEALHAITRQGIASALVAASGDLAFSKAPPGETGWRIGVDSLDSANAPFTRVLDLSDGAMSTSGSTEQHLDQGGVRYSHIIDPVSGIGLTRDITVSVISGRGIDADGLDTAISVLGVKRGLELLKHYPGSSAIILLNENGRRHLIDSTQLAKGR